MIRAFSNILFPSSPTASPSAGFSSRPQRASPITTPPQSPVQDSSVEKLWTCQWPTQAQVQARSDGWETIDTVQSATLSAAPDNCQFVFDDEEAWINVNSSDSDIEQVEPGVEEDRHGNAVPTEQVTEQTNARSQQQRSSDAQPRREDEQDVDKKVRGQRSHQKKLSTQAKQERDEVRPKMQNGKQEMEARLHEELRSIGERAKAEAMKLEQHQQQSRVQNQVNNSSNRSHDHAVDKEEQETARKIMEHADRSAADRVSKCKQESAQQPPQWLVKKQKPNAPCACGSGKKFKKCW
eukprot:COSAG02_NODE_129_length_34796_cov_26.576015_13_plen_295_part_00